MQSKPGLDSGSQQAGGKDRVARHCIRPLAAMALRDRVPSLQAGAADQPSLPSGARD
jgi:hypothetical protein